MAIRWLTPALEFPPPESADDEGVVAVGGDCSVERLLLAYRSGIFPWPMAKNLPLFWFSPDPRYVIPLAQVHLPRSLRKELRLDPSFRWDDSRWAVFTTAYLLKGAPAASRPVCFAFNGGPGSALAAPKKPPPPPPAESKIAPSTWPVAASDWPCAGNAASSTAVARATVTGILPIVLQCITASVIPRHIPLWTR